MTQFMGKPDNPVNVRYFHSGPIPPTARRLVEAVLPSFDQRRTPARWAARVIALLLVAATGVSALGGPVSASDQPETTTLGVVTFNILGPRARTEAGRTQITTELRTLMRNPGIDVIGFQEGNRLGPILNSLRVEGWSYYQVPGDENPIAWRDSRFTLAQVPENQVRWKVSTRSQRIRRHFPDRFLSRVLLSDAVSHRTVAVFNTHVNQFIEKFGRPRGRTQNWRQARLHFARMAIHLSQSPGEVSVLTGDLNVDAAYDARVRHPALPFIRYRKLAWSNYRFLGIPRQHTSFEGAPRRRARIDYVFLRLGNRVGARMVSQLIRAGFRAGSGRSDHVPVQVTFLLPVGPSPQD